jgi:hypothetical protein
MRKQKERHQAKSIAGVDIKERKQKARDKAGSCNFKSSSQIHILETDYRDIGLCWYKELNREVQER